MLQFLLLASRRSSRLLLFERLLAVSSSFTFYFLNGTRQATEATTGQDYFDRTGQT